MTGQEEKVGCDRRRVGVRQGEEVGECDLTGENVTDKPLARL